jgi:hypothetical protein
MAADYKIVHRTDGPAVIVLPDGTSMLSIAGGTDDYAGFKAATTAFLNSLPTDKGLVSADHPDLNAWLTQLVAKYRAAMTGQGITV